MGSLPRKVVCIIGAGIAGPTLALQLLSHARLAARFRPILFDHSPNPAAVSSDEEKRHRPSAGAAIGIFSNGLYPLYQLGLRDKLHEASSEFAGIRVWRGSLGDGDNPGLYRYLNGCKNTCWSAELQTGPRSIERNRLQALLLEAVRKRGGEVRWDRRIEIIKTVGTGTRLRFDDGSEIYADLLVGADGGFSYVRRFILSQRDPLTAEDRWLPDFMNLTGFYGMSSGYFLDPSDPRTTEIHGIWLDQGYLSTAWLPGGKIRWDLVLPETAAPPSPYTLKGDEASTPAGFGWERSIYPSAYPRASTVELLRKHAGVYHPLAGSFGGLLENAERVIRSPLRQRVWKADEIHLDSIALIGDAARLMLPSSGQGTGFAVEDATVLAGNLLKHLDRPTKGDGFRTPLEKYAHERVARSQRMARTAYWAGKLGTGKTWAWRTIRDRLPLGVDMKEQVNHFVSESFVN